MGAAFGGKSELFYNQFELYSREQKVTQIILLKDAIYRIKTTFNKEFDEVLKKKELELSKVLISGTPCATFSGIPCDLVLHRFSC